MKGTEGEIPPLIMYIVVTKTNVYEDDGYGQHNWRPVDQVHYYNDGQFRDFMAMVERCAKAGAECRAFTATEYKVTLETKVVLE